jgi:hypothetical protein
MNADKELTSYRTLHQIYNREGGGLYYKKHERTEHCSMKNDRIRTENTNFALY